MCVLDMPENNAGKLRHHKNRSNIKSDWHKVLDKIMIVIGILGPVSTLPQVFKIWLEKNPTGVSVTTWGSYIILQMFWLFYGISHKDMVILINSILWIILEIIIVIGTLLYM